MASALVVFAVLASAIIESGICAGIDPVIPVIDISSLATGPAEERQRVANEVDRAFVDFGFAVITGHGVDDHYFDEIYVAGKKFFQQPLSQKAPFDVGKGYGYGGYVNHMEAGGKLSGENVTQSDGVESLTIRGIHHLASSENICLNGFFVTQFGGMLSDMPQADAVPCFPSSLLPSVVRLNSALFQFKETMTTIAELALGASPGDFHKFLNPAKGGMRFAYYPEREADNFSHHIDYGAHADSGSMVFLRLDRDNPSGTEVLHKGRWLPVPHIPGGVVVNLGNVLSRLTGGRWKSVIHRATRRNHKERLSLVLGALVPDNNLSLECLPSICGSQSGNNRKVSVKEYIDARLRLQRPDQSASDVDIVNFIDKHGV